VLVEGNINMRDGCG